MTPSKIAGKKAPDPADPQMEVGRTAQTKARIADAVTTVIAEVGLSRLTHRLVATEAGVSLAATTYHYATKRDMIADASARLLASYVSSFQRAAKRQWAGDPVAPDMATFAIKLLTNSAGRFRRSSLAWCEIILDAARSPEGHALATTWFAELFDAWRDLAAAMQIDSAEDAVVSTVDTVIGMLFITLPLGLPAVQILNVMRTGRGLERRWAPAKHAPLGGQVPLKRATPKAQNTRARILDAAINLLVEEGPGAVTYKAVAAASGLTTAAPAYYFGSIAGLLNSAEVDLFRRSKERYRDVRETTHSSSALMDALTDLTAAIFVREATHYGRYAIAIYSIWLEASRQPELRPEIWEGILDQARAWTRQLHRIDPDASLLEGMRMQAVYIGKLIRSLSTGVPVSLLAVARREFQIEIKGHTGRSPETK